MTTAPATTKVRAGLYQVDLEIESTGDIATFDISYQAVGDDERLRWVVTAEDAEGRTVVEYGDSGEYTTKRAAVETAVFLARTLVPHPQYRWVTDRSRAR